jgi:hypothetical protein
MSLANSESAIRQSGVQKTKIENVISDDTIAEGTFRKRPNVGLGSTAYSRKSSSASVVVGVGSPRMGFQSDGSSFFGLFTRGEISRIRISSEG